jgi:uncharacterized BrkB/YihY/UPF0761 family membrane protein
VGVEGLRLLADTYLTVRLARVDNLYGAAGVGAAFMAILYIAARLMVAALALNAARSHSMSECSQNGHDGRLP